MLSNASLIYILLELAIAALAVLGNVLVCWAVCINSNLQSVTNFFLVSLAVADIAVGVLAIPFAVAISTGFCAHFYGCLFIACFVLVLTQSSIFSLLAIAIDRYIAIKMPLRYNSLVTGRRAKEIVAICWLLSVVIGLTPMLGWNKCPRSANSSCPPGMVECLFEGVVTMDYMVYFNFFACVLVPLLIMLAVYLRIFLAARRQLKLMELKAAHGEGSRSTLQKEVHAAKSLAIIVGLFVVCWLPLHVINCFTLFCPGCARPPPEVMYLAILLSHANSVVNPLIYAYRIREFRLTFRRIIRHMLGRPDSDGARGRCGDGWAAAHATQVNGFALDPGATRDGSSERLRTTRDSPRTIGHWNPCVESPTPACLPSSLRADARGSPHLRQPPCVVGHPLEKGPHALRGSAVTKERASGEETSTMQVKSLFCKWTNRCPELAQVSCHL